MVDDIRYGVDASGFKLLKYLGEGLYNGGSADKKVWGEVVVTSPLPPKNIAPNQVSVSTTATLIVAARAGRSAVTIINLGTTDVWTGNSDVTTTTGQLLVGVKGAGLSIGGETAIYGIVSSGSQRVSYLEEF